MTTLQIIGLVLLVGGVLGYGALFLYVLTNDKRRERREAEYDGPEFRGRFVLFRSGMTQKKFIQPMPGDFQGGKVLIDREGGRV